MGTTELGVIIRKLRKEKGWTQEKLAKKAGLTNVTISEIESGVTELPKTQTIKKLAFAFKMEMHELLSYKIESDSIEENTEIKFELEEEIIEWLKTPESKPFIKFAYNLSKQIPINLLGKLKFLVDPNLDERG